jgi:hypothetical protein
MMDGTADVTNTLPTLPETIEYVAIALCGLKAILERHSRA